MLDAVTSSGLGLFSMLRRRVFRDDSVPVFPRGIKGGKFLGLKLKRYPSAKVRSFGLLSSSSRSSGYYLGRDGIGLHQFDVLGRTRSRNFSTNVKAYFGDLGNTENGKSTQIVGKGVAAEHEGSNELEDLVESLLSARNKLVVVDFFSSSCGGCKALHPKICQIAEMNPDALFLQVNYEEHKSMCYSLGVHVLPFCPFYQGTHGRICSFDCTVATIKKFRDALAKHNPNRCSLGCAKGLEEKELVALTSNKDLSFSYTPKSSPDLDGEHAEVITEPVPSHVHLGLSLPSVNTRSPQDSNHDPLITMGR